MYCPQCGGEYREGFVECADCGVALVAELPAPEPEVHDDSYLVTVLEVSNPGLLAVAESLLMAEKIPYLKKGEQVQDMFAWGRFPSGMSLAVGPIVLQVFEEHAEAARELLKDLEAAEPEDSKDSEPPTPSEPA